MFLLANGGTILLTLGAILLALGPGSGFWFIVGVGASTIGLVWEIWKARRYARLDRERRASLLRARQRATSLNAILDSTLQVLMSDLSGDFSRARISVYRHKGDSFFLLARVSKSQALRRIGRQRYPDGEGVIGTTWDIAQKVVTNLPEKRPEWNEQCVAKYGMSAATASGLTMHSRSLLGQRIDTQGTNPVPVGIVIIESLKARGVSGTTQGELVGSPLYPLIRAVLVEVIQCLDEDDVADFRAGQA